MADRVRPHFADVACPRCARKTVRVNDVGAWCDGYPCRWSITKRNAEDAARIVRDLWKAIGGVAR